jgi:hypothetical protein
MKFLITSQLGPKQSLTKEGFLLCLDVPLARTGTMRYLPEELPDIKVVPAPGENIAYIHREDEDLFNQYTIASCEGKPFIDEHPDAGEITVENFRELFSGVMLNVHRSEEEPDLLLGDLIVYDPYLIKEIQAGKREVSLGYAADYDAMEDQPGHYRQYNILINHIALVEVGRCGQRCSIGDHDTVRLKEKTTMPQKTLKQRFLDAVNAMKTSGTKDTGELEKLAAELPDRATGDAEPGAGASAAGAGAGGGPVGEQHTHIHLHHGAGGNGISSGGLDEGQGGPGAGAAAAAAEKEPVTLESIAAQLTELTVRVAKLEAGTGAGDGAAAEEEEAPAAGTEDSAAELKKVEGELKEEAPEGTSDSAISAAVQTTKDSALIADSFQECLAFAEILSPGIELPTFDKAMAPKDTLARVCSFRKMALLKGNEDPDTHQIIEEVRGRTTTADILKALTCDSIRPLFRNAAIAKRRANAAASRATHDAGNGSHMAGVSIPVNSPADLNRINAEYWKGK